MCIRDREELQNVIKAELAKIKWIIYNDVNLEFFWYFSCLRKKGIAVVPGICCTVFARLDSTFQLERTATSRIEKRLNGEIGDENGTP